MLTSSDISATKHSDVFHTTTFSSHSSYFTTWPIIIRIFVESTLQKILCRNKRIRERQKLAAAAVYLFVPLAIRVLPRWPRFPLPFPPECVRIAAVFVPVLSSLPPDCYDQHLLLSREQRLEYHVQHNVARKTSASVWWLPAFCVCVCVCVSLLFLSITITGEVWTTLPCSSAQACVAAMRTGGVRMCQEEVVLLLLFITHTRAVTALFVLHAFTYFILLICTHQSLQQLSGNPLVRGSMHVGVWEDSPGCRRWNTNAALRKPWRMAVSCCRC